MNLIITLPGLLTKDENGRLEEIMRNFSDVEVRNGVYSGIRKEGNRITCPFSIEEFAKDTLDLFANTGGYQSVGVLASSVGTAVFSYLFSREIPVPDFYVSISPFFKLNKELIPLIEYCKKNNMPLDIGSPHDKEKGVTRTVPNVFLENILMLNANAGFNPRKIEKVLTLIGCHDERADIAESEKHHQSISGKSGKIVYYDSGHALPLSSNNDVIDFLNGILN